MPFTKEELKGLDSYQKLINELRTTYLDRILELKDVDFRVNGVLFSFEDIKTNNLGLEKVLLEQDDLYKDINLTKEDLEKLKSKHNKKYPVYVTSEILERTIDRNISELSTSKFAEILPRGLKNGDVVTSDNFEDRRIFLIQNNQKKPFLDIGIFYIDYDVSKLKTIEDSQLQLIPEGDEVE